MKKVFAVFLAALMCFVCLAVPAFADDGYTKAHSVTVPEEQQKMFKIVPVGTESCYVADGGVFRFRIETIGSYSANDATCYRAFAAETYYTDIIKSNEENIADFTYDSTDRLVCDENGVYTIGNEMKGIECDIVIVSYNLMNNTGSSLVDFLTRLGKFFTDFINWFFGLAKVKVG